MATTIRQSAPTLSVLAGFAAVYCIWGSTYLAIAVAVETFPPFLMAGARVIVAGSILLALARSRGVPWPSASEWRAACWAGGMMCSGVGLVAWSEQSIPSGYAALLITTVSMWLIIIDWLTGAGPRPTARVALGLVVGFSGVAVLVLPGAVSGTLPVMGALGALAGAVAWAGGSIATRSPRMSRSTLMTSAQTTLAGGAVLTLIATLTGEWSRLDLTSASRQSVLAVIYLTLFGSVIALTAYQWLLRVSTPRAVSTYAFVNPVVAVLLGWALLGEELAPGVMLAGAMVVFAVALITLGPTGAVARE